MGSAVADPATQSSSPSGEELALKIDELLARLGSVPDPVARESAEELVGTLMQFYGQALEKVIELLFEAGEAASPIIESLMADQDVATVLMVHGLYPVSLEDRVEDALESVRPYLRSHGGDVELVTLKEDVAYLRLVGTCQGCAASKSTLALTLMPALDEAAPDLLGVQVDGAIDPPRRRRRLPIAGERAPTNGHGSLLGWVTRLEPPGVLGGGMVPLDIEGTEIIVARVNGTLFAYRNDCPGCGGQVHRGDLARGILTCPGCQRQYDVPLAGRGVDEPLQLAPIPLFVEDGQMRIAVVS